MARTVTTAIEKRIALLKEAIHHRLQEGPVKVRGDKNTTLCGILLHEYSSDLFLHAKVMYDPHLDRFIGLHMWWLLEGLGIGGYFQPLSLGVFHPQKKEWISEAVEHAVYTMAVHTKIKGRYMVMVKSEHGPAYWRQDRSKYIRVGVVEVDWDVLMDLEKPEPSMLSPRARGIRRVIHLWEHLYLGVILRPWRTFEPEGFTRIDPQSEGALVIDEANEEAQRRNMALVRGFLGLSPGETWEDTA